MNPYTGQVFVGPEAIQKAKDRDEPIVAISPQVAELLQIGRIEKERRRKANKQARKSRTRNR